MSEPLTSEEVPVSRGAHGFNASYLPREPQIYCQPRLRSEPEPTIIEQLQKELDWDPNRPAETRRQPDGADVKVCYNEPLTLDYVIFGHVHTILVERWVAEAPQVRAALLREGELLRYQLKYELEHFENVTGGVMNTLLYLAGKRMDLYPKELLSYIPVDDLRAWALERKERAQASAAGIEKTYEALLARCDKAYGSLSGSIEYKHLYPIGLEFQNIRRERALLFKRINDVRLMIEDAADDTLVGLKFIDKSAWSALDILTDGVSMFNPAQGIAYKIAVFVLKFGARATGNLTAGSGFNLSEDERKEFREDLKKTISAIVRNLFKRGNIKAFNWSQNDLTEAMVEIIVGINVDMVFWVHDNGFNFPPEDKLEEWLIELGWSSAGKLAEGYLGCPPAFGDEGRTRQWLFYTMAQKFAGGFITSFRQALKDHENVKPQPTALNLGLNILGGAFMNCITSIPDIAMGAVLGRKISSSAANRFEDKGRLIDDKWLNKSPGGSGFSAPTGARGKDWEDTLANHFGIKPEPETRIATEAEMVMANGGNLGGKWDYTQANSPFRGPPQAPDRMATAAELAMVHDADVPESRERIATKSEMEALNNPKPVVNPVVFKKKAAVDPAEVTQQRKSEPPPPKVIADAPAPVKPPREQVKSVPKENKPLVMVEPPAKGRDFYPADAPPPPPRRKPDGQVQKPKPKVKQNAQAPTKERSKKARAQQPASHKANSDAKSRNTAPLGR